MRGAVLRQALRLAVLVVVTFEGAPAMAESDLCQAVALIDAPGWVGYNKSGPPDIIIHKGEIYDEISVYQEDPQTGMGSFCEHGGGCVDRYVIRNGVKVEALRLQNCTIRKVANPGPNDYDFELVLDRSKVDPTTLRYTDIDDRLLQLGLCNACADNVADEYIHHPQSACSQLVRSALEGNPDAAEELSPDSGMGACADVPSLSDDSDAAASDAAAPASSAATPVGSSSAAPSPAPSPPSKSNSAPKVMLLILLAAVAACLYFLPTIIAGARRKRNMPAIFALNLLLGWTFLGWVAALVWSFVKDNSRMPGVAKGT